MLHLLRAERGIDAAHQTVYNSTSLKQGWCSVSATFSSRSVLDALRFFLSSSLLTAAVAVKPVVRVHFSYKV
jgi:hypothetical protein